MVVPGVKTGHFFCYYFKNHYVRTDKSVTMFYLYQGDVHVTPAGQDVPEYKAVKSEFPKEFKYGQIVTYIYYVFTKKDNPYWNLPPLERREQIVSNYNLFDEWSSWKEIEKNESVISLIDFYKKIQLSDNDLNVDMFRAKAEHWRKKLMDMNNTPEEELAFAKALETATKLAEEFKIKSELETGDGDNDGIALYLFEIPENKKPHHARMKI